MIHKGDLVWRKLYFVDLFQIFNDRILHRRRVERLSVHNFFNLFVTFHEACPLSFILHEVLLGPILLRISH